MAQPLVKPRRHASDWRPTPQARPTLVTSWDSAIESFLRDARARNCSPATLIGYRGYLLGPRMRQFVADYDIKSVADVTPDMLRSFTAELLDAGLSAGTAATFHRIMRNFLGYCEREGYGAVHETLAVAAPKLPEMEPETFSELDEKRLLDACRSDRDRMLILFMLRTGLRRNEVLNVRIDDIIDGGNGVYVKVRQGKGRKDRIVPLDTANDHFSKKLFKFIRTDRPETSDNHLWMSSKKDLASGDYPPLDDEGLKSVLQRLQEATGVHVHAHKFRHTFATRALAAGVDSLVLQRALGHTTLAMVNRYVHFQTNDVLDAWRHRRD